MRPASPYDALIVGGGHNGLVCAFYLARAGHKVRILERAPVVGGAAITEEFHPGFRNSTASYSVSLLNPKVIADMELARHGLRVVLRPLSYFAPVDDRRYLIMDRDPLRTRREVARWSQKDAERLEAFHARLERLVALLRGLILERPWNASASPRDLVTALSLLGRARKLGLQGQADLLDLFGKSAGDMLDAWFETDVLKGLLGFDAVVGNYASPYTPGSAYVLIHHIFGEANRVKGRLGPRHRRHGIDHPGRCGARPAPRLGAEITTDAAVKEIAITARQARRGVVLHDGSDIAARVVVSNVNPKILFGALVAPEHLSEPFKERIDAWKCGSGAFRMNVALSELPDFTCLSGLGPAEHHGASIIIAPSLGYLDEAYTDAPPFRLGARATRRDACPQHAGRQPRPARPPCGEPLLPPVRTPSARRPAGRFELGRPPRGGGRPGDRHPDRLRAQLQRRGARPHDPLAAGSGAEAGADWRRHLPRRAQPRPDVQRPAGAGPRADYRAPIKGLYMCGSGTHPGGGVTGAPGHNAAREILRDLGRPRRATAG